MLTLRKKGLYAYCFAAVLLAAASSAFAQTDSPHPSLFTRLGGLAPISVEVNDYIDALVPDSMLNQNQSGHRRSAAAR